METLYRGWKQSRPLSSDELFFDGVTVLSGADGELFDFTDEGQFKGLQHGGQLDVFNDHRALDLVASDWGIEQPAKDGCTHGKTCRLRFRD